MIFKSRLIQPFRSVLIPFSALISNTKNQTFNLAKFNLQPLAKLPHSDVYIVDSNLLIGYVKNYIVGWKDWASAHIALGNKFYILEQTLKEVTVKTPNLPDGFELLKVILFQCQLEHEGFGKPQHNLDVIYNEIAKELNIQGKLKEKLKIDIELIGAAGYYAAAADPSQISDEDFFADRVVFASNNFMAIKRIVSTEERRKIVEKILDDAGFEHLITVRLIASNETWGDFA